MPGDPHSGSKVWKAPHRQIGKPGENRGKVIAHRDLQPTAAFHDRENRRNLRSRLWAADAQPILSTKSYQFSARLVLSSNAGHSKKRVSFFHSASPYWQALLSALEGKAADCAASILRISIAPPHTAAHKLGHQLLNFRTGTSLGR
jgi:hypothetical protein